jgi:23S rRNA pseudouridine2605 synthase
MKQSPFGKFQGEKGARKKERIRQEKKEARKAKKEYFEKKKAEERAKRSGTYPVSSFEENSSRAKKSGSRYSKAGTRKGKTGASAARPEKRSSKPSAQFEESDAREKQVSSYRSKSGKSSIPAAPVIKAKPGGEMPLNKFIAHAGVCSRRDAAELVKSGKVTVNGQQILEPGFKVNGTEEVKVNGKKISARKNLVYILLNKPKDYLTTVEDPQGRKTVLDIVRNATTERIYPVGRLDRNTTGVLLLTNDGELAQKLSHPSYQVKKIYEVKLDKPLTKKDFDTLLKGITLEDGFIAPDALAYADAKDRSVIGIEIHSGRNRIVRRLFEHLGYDVRALDRVMYANLTKKNVERGKWRFLTEKEVRLLKYLNASYTKK